MKEYISREKAIEAIKRIMTNCNPNDFDLDDKEGYGWWMHSNGENLSVIKAALEIEKVPAADVKPVVRGHWDGDACPRCSECGALAKSDKENVRVCDDYDNFDGILRFYKSVKYDIVYHKTNFCPNCGADMRTEGH